MNRTSALAALAIPAFACTNALAQTDIHHDHKYAWSENVGFLNFRDAGAPAGAQGVRLSSPHSPAFLSGFIWGENIGWINVGDGTPADAGQYANVNNTDYGVNIDLSGNLSGYAWGENVGWINFSGGALATPANPARFDEANHRFRGYAWAPNIGWINLDHAVDYVGVYCPADINQDGFVDGIDYDTFNNWFEDHDPRVQMQADYNRDGFVDGIDYDNFNNDFETPCP